MFNPVRKLMALALGNYIVVESLNYGQQKRHRRLGRFANLESAKAFAKEQSANLQSRVVVLAADKLAKICVYRPREQRFDNAHYA
ncbi:MAG: hypothetical protein EON60_11025 [Alphaproteobacteria bacterium]|nr:MAG: hypothetical protein EON60_11025 [Alphaproteobacteria bacterium]